MDYKSAALMLHIKIAAFVGKINEEIKAIEDELISLKQKEQYLEQEVGSVESADDRIGEKLSDLMDEHQMLNEQLSALDENNVDFSRIKFKMLQIEHQMDQLNKRLSDSKGNADKNALELNNIKQLIIEKNDRLDVLRAKVGEKEAQSAEVKDMLNDRSYSAPEKSIIYSVYSINKRMTQAEEDKNSILSNIIYNDPELSKAFNEASEIGSDRQMDEILAKAARSNPEIKQKIEEINTLVKYLNKQKKLGVNAEIERRRVAEELEDIRTPISRMQEILNNYFAAYRGFFVPEIVNVMVDTIKRELENNPNYVQQFFYTEDDETMALSQERITDENDLKRFKNIIQTDDAAIRKMIEDNVRNNRTARNYAVRVVLPVFLTNEKYDKVERPSKTMQQVLAAQAFVNYFFNPEGGINPRSEINMPATEIINRIYPEIKSYLSTLKEDSNLQEETPDTPQVDIPADDEFGYLLFKKISGGEVDEEKLIDAIKKLYFSLYNDHLEFNTWQKNFYLGSNYINAYKGYQNEIAISTKSIRNLQEKLQEALKDNNGEASEISEQIKTAIKEELLKASKIKANFEQSIQNSLGLDSTQQNVMKQLLSSRTETSEARIVVRANMVFGSNHSATFTASLSTPLNAHRDAGFIEYNIKKIGKKEPKLSNIKITLNKKTTQPVFKEVQKKNESGQVTLENVINNVGQTSNIRSELIKILKQFKKQQPSLSNKELIKRNKEDIIDELKHQIYGDNYKYFVYVFTDKKTGNKTKGHPLLQDVIKRYDAEIKKQLEEMATER